MKRKSSQPDFLSALQTSRPSADAAFVHTLKQKLLAQAEEILPEPRVSGLAFIFQSMKRYSLAYAGALVLVAFGTMMLLPRGLDPQEFLAKASEQYEVQTGIFHEERLSQRFENDIAVEASLEEVWMDEQGNFLQTIRNPDTKELVQASLFRVDENGNTYAYEDAAGVEAMGGVDETEKTLNGEKYYCAEIEIKDDTIYKAFLKIAAEDLSIYTVDGESGDYPEQTEAAMTPQEQLLSQDNSASTVKELLETLANGNSSESQAYIEGDYFIFEWDASAEDSDGIHQRTVYDYFNLENYKLEKQKLTFGDEPNRYDLTSYLIHEYLPAEQADKIFDPSGYNLVTSGGQSAGGPDYIQESGCYYKGEKLSEDEAVELLKKVPEEGVTQWKELMQNMQNANTASSEEEFNVVPEVTNNEMSFIRPTTGDITQGFHAGHPAYDIANRAQPDILAVASGTITYASAGTWDGGYGDNIWIDHGNGYRTHYANMDEIYVKEGDTVIQGQVIGKMGRTGRVYGVTGIHLHFELEYNGEKVSPSIMNVW